MKHFFIIASFFSAMFTLQSQSLSYQDLALLFSENDANGSARFTGMGGAFGALGGDISATNINPAGLAIFNNSAFSGTFTNRNTNTTANYYGNSTLKSDAIFTIGHLGAVLVFDSAYNSNWSKFAIGFNYRITKDFANSFLAEGNSGVATFRDFPKDTKIPTTDYNTGLSQRFSNTYNGDLSELNFAFSSVHKNRLYVGMGLNFYNLNFAQQASLNEQNTDGNNNNLEVNLYQENITTGAGFSANLGFIYKIDQNFRFGLAYQTPKWFSEILQDTNFNQDNDIDIGPTTFVQGNKTYRESNDWQYIAYRLKTPSKLTTSAAYIFGKNGLVSIDYAIQNYRNLKLSDGNFSEENKFFQNELRNTHSVNIGTEWRLKEFSFRGGYRFEQSPDKLALSSDNLTGYSLGGGYNFGNFKIDLAFSDTNRTSIYNFYSGFDVNPANLTIDNRIVTGTFTINL